MMLWMSVTTICNSAFRLGGYGGEVIATPSRFVAELNEMAILIGEAAKKSEAAQSHHSWQTQLPWIYPFETV